MNDQITFQGCDPVLLPFLRTSDPEVGEELLTELIQHHADPIISKILKSKLRVTLNGSHGSHENQDALEIASELRATLIRDLQTIRQHPAQKSITSFPDYVAVKTYSACADYFREKNPRRWRLKNALRHQLKQHPRFALWKAENGRWYAGLNEWHDSAVADTLSPNIPALKNQRGKPDDDLPIIIELLNEIFERSGAPLEFERVVTLVAGARGITDTPPQSIESPDNESGVHELVSSPRVDLLLEQRLYLEKLWEEVCRLPVLQRAALLLNLRDAPGGSAIFFIPHLGVASRKQIAEVLEMPDDFFSKLWDELPLDDARIAGMLGITRQQVINLRKTARERLARRMEKATNRSAPVAADGKKGG